MFKHILIATDGSEASDHAASLAVNLARMHGARVTALFVVDPDRWPALHSFRGR